ncbi:hypothetical protein IC757_06720 [Wenzhouxiangella sp. AB-CW3]|uniref:hypothetical protein n=1 Tax=Wenzhouxiangella sp. AB-CW3 TaxID=2771012 RepID=UPI00168AA534|nr:hypothetical protein [Wenzhouxiangella sp. AB-CW3]QOC23812.1 hypothetical protein IC757_06720 [Wenzhouxiangella sp. AB-CW3]
MIRLLSSMVVSALLLWGGFSLYALTGDRYQQVIPGIELEPDILDWQVLIGDGGLDAAGYWLVSGEERTRLLRLGIRLPQPLVAESVERVNLQFGPGAQHRRMDLGWSRDGTFTTTRQASIEMVDGVNGTVRTDWYPRWEDEIRYLSVELVGGTREPLVLRRVELVPARPDILAFQRRLFGEWFSFPPWTQRSAHFTMVAAHEEVLSPSLAVAAWLGLSLLLLAAWSRLRGNRMHWQWPVLLVPLAVGWLVLDLRWQANMVVRAVDAFDSFGGLSWQEKGSDHFDGELFDFMRELEKSLGQESPRVFALGFGEFWRLRARYHGLPLSIRTTDRPLEKAWVSHLAGGDLLLVLDAPHVRDEQLPGSDSPEGDAGPGDIALKRAAGKDARVELVDGRAVLSLPDGTGELLRTRFPLSGRPAAYRVRLELATAGQPADLSVAVRRRYADGPWMTTSERQLRVEAYGGVRDLVFAAEQGALYELTVNGVQGEGLQVRSAAVDLVEEPGLVYLQSSGQDGPLLVVRPIKRGAIGTAYEIL